MKQYIPDILNLAWYLFIGYMLISTLRKTDKSKREKRIWLSLGIGFWAILVVFTAYGNFKETHTRLANNRVPSKSEVTKAFNEAGQFALDESTYKSEDGYSILVPEGFVYLPQKNGTLSFVAAKEGPNNISYSLIVKRREAMGYIYNTVPRIIAEIEKQVEDFKYEISGEGKSRKISYSFTDDEGSNLGTMLVIKNGKFFYYVTILAKNTPADNNDIKAEIERVANSFKLISQLSELPFAAANI